jgi:hypothetical protein
LDSQLRMVPTLSRMMTMSSERTTMLGTNKQTSSILNHQPEWVSLFVEILKSATSMTTTLLMII